jgi:hypothetical protein
MVAHMRRTAAMQKGKGKHAALKRWTVIDGGKGKTPTDDDKTTPPTAA